MEALDYGLTCADMPEGDDALIEAWDKLADAYRALEPLAQAVEKLLAGPQDAARDEAGGTPGSER